MSTKKEVVKKEEGGLALYQDYEGDSGFEDTSSDDYTLPFIKLLQKGSPEVDEDNGAYIDGAKAGMYIDTGTGEIFEEVVFIPCYYKRAMVEWVPVEDGGGFVAQHEVGYEQKFPQDDRGRWTTEDGHYIADTRYYFGLRVVYDKNAKAHASHAVASFSSTQLKKSRKWMTKMQALKFEGKGGLMKTYPIFAHMWRFTSVGEENDQFSWKGYKIEIVERIDDPALVEAAQEARKMFATASQSVKPPVDGEETIPGF